MKYEGLTLEYVKFIDDYKVGKVKALVKKIKKFYEDLTQNETEKLFQAEKEERKRCVNNLFEHIDVGAIVQYIEHAMLNEKDVTSLWSSNELRSQWRKDVSILRQKWNETQQEAYYKAQSLKTAIPRDTIKALKTIPESDNCLSQIKAIIARALDQGWLELEFEVLLDGLKQGVSAEQIKAIEAEKQKWTAELLAISNKYNYTKWLGEACQNAVNVSFSTHVAKLTHSSIKGATSIYFDEEDEDPQYLTTAALNDKPIDVSQTDNKYAPIGKFLKLKFGGSTAADKLIKSDLSDFEVFAEDDEQLNKWQQGFLNAFEDRHPSSHSLAKQLYYPVGESYHLLSPLVSSSLDQRVFERITHAKFDNTSKEIRQQKRNDKYHTNTEISYPNIAILKVTASNHGNASPLNGERGGRRYLFSSLPPMWKSSLKPPINQQNMYYGELDSRARATTRSLQKYLLALRNQKSNKRIRDNVKGKVKEIIDTLFQYVAEIQNMTEQAGWSEQASSLKEAHRLWLDPFRQDEQFQQKRKRGDWKNEVCYDFGLWLNKRIKHEKMEFEKLDAKSWANILKKRLREFELDLEVLS